MTRPSVSPTTYTDGADMYALGFRRWQANECAADIMGVPDLPTPEPDYEGEVNIVSAPAATYVRAHGRHQMPGLYEWAALALSVDRGRRVDLADEDPGRLYTDRGLVANWAPEMTLREHVWRGAGTLAAQGRRYEPWRAALLVDRLDAQAEGVEW